MIVNYLDIERAHSLILPELKNALEKVIKSGWLILGKELEDFEKKYAKFSGTKYAVGVANGLDALILSLMALEVGDGDEVIVPSNTYIATLLAISRVGAKPILVEPNKETYNIDPIEIERKISKNTKVIIPVHLFGQVAQMDAIMKIARKHKLFVVEDNAQSHGATYERKMAGSFGHINATSFYPGKNLGALGDGGMITTNNKSLYEKVILIRNYGSKIKYYNEVKGYNSRLDELQAAFLKIKLIHLKSNNKLRKEKADKYISELKNIGDIILPLTHPDSTHVYHIFNIRTKKRESLKKYLDQNRIGNLIHYPVPPHLQKAYAELGFKKGDFPIAEELASTSISLPIYPELSNDEQNFVILKIKEFYEK
ncbi:MAG: DegT/DnrJ/EryC1/StrS family aminotransferase [Niabella sp.]|nr:MAG: DegT/DnrJ/EryC1/StrS family aminotransferase [Niabella sp.]